METGVYKLMTYDLVAVQDINDMTVVLHDIDNFTVLYLQLYAEIIQPFAHIVLKEIMLRWPMKTLKVVWDRTPKPKQSVGWRRSRAVNLIHIGGAVQDFMFKTFSIFNEDWMVFGQVFHRKAVHKRKII